MPVPVSIAGHSAHAAVAPLCVLEDLRVAFRRHDGEVDEVVRGLSFHLAPGERLGIVGESGSGKSLSGRALLGLLPPTARWSAGQMRLGKTSLLALSDTQRRRLCGREMGMILQDPKYSLNPVMTVAQQMAEAFVARERPAGQRMGSRALREQILAALAAVHIRDPKRVAASYPHELSGGMGQRVMIAMMVSGGPRLLVADEPTSALDVLVSTQVLEVLDEMIAQHNTGLIFISHDLPLVMSFCDRVIVMYAGQVVESCAAADLPHAQHPYTQGLLAAMPPLVDPPENIPVLQRDPAWRLPTREPR